MFYYLSGTVAHVEPYLAVIDCGGVGYACRTTSYTLSALKKGEKGKLFTYLSVRQDGVDLFGFATQEELNLFQQLTSVSGVGPRRRCPSCPPAPGQSGSVHHHRGTRRPSPWPRASVRRLPSASSWS